MRPILKPGVRKRVWRAVFARGDALEERRVIASAGAHATPRLVPANVVDDATRAPSCATSFGLTLMKTSGERTPARIRFASFFAAAGFALKVDAAFVQGRLDRPFHRRHQRARVEHGNDARSALRSAAGAIAASATAASEG